MATSTRPPVDLDLSGTLESASSSTAKAKEDIINLTTAMKEAVKQAVNFAATAEVIRERSTGTKNAMSDTLSIMAKQGNERIKEKDILSRIKESETRSASAQAQLTEARRKAATYVGITTQEELDANKAIIEALESQIQKETEMARILETIRSNLEANNAAVDQMENKTKSVAKIFRSLSKIPIIGPLLPIHAATAAIEKAQQEGKKGFDLYVAGVQGMAKEMRGGFGWVMLFAGAVKTISVAFDLVKNAVKHFFELDKLLTKISNNIGLSEDGMKGMTNSFRDTVEYGKNITESLDNSFLSITNQANAMLEIQDAFSTNSILSDQILQNQILLTKQMGLEAEQAAGIQKLGILNKTSAESILSIAAKTNTANISNKKIISEIAKINAEISASYKNNPELIASAVVQAEKLGLSLEETRKMSESLLDFESSISNELEAELLSGQQLNFEKARSLALDGKSAEAAAELVRQMGGLNKLTNMNVIVRGSMAKSIGMTSEELMKSAQQQEVLNKLGIESKDALNDRYNQLISIGKRDEAEALMADVKKQKNGELLAQDISRASIASRFEESMLRIKDIFATQLMGPIMSISNLLIKLTNNAGAMKVIFVGLVALAAAFAASMVTAAMAITAAMGGTNLAAAAISAAVVGGGLATYAVVSDSAIAPSGQIMISTPKGMIKPDPQDSIITTTDPGSLLSGGGGSSSGVESRLDQLLSVMSKGGNVYIDSVRSGTAYGMSYNSYA
jgi:hypothetical protein